MRKNWVILLLGCVLSQTVGCVLSQTVATKNLISETYDGVKSIRLGTASADVIIKPSADESVHLFIEHSHNPDIYQPQLKHDGEDLDLKEKFRSSPSPGHASWTLSVPNHLKIRFKTGSGDFTISDLTGDVNATLGSGDVDVSHYEGELTVNEGSGDIDIAGFSGELKTNTGSGRIEIDTATGDIEVSSGSGPARLNNISGELSVSEGSGDIEVNAYRPSGPSRFSSGSGDVEISLANAPTHDIALSSGSGDVKLDFNDQPISGEIEMRVNKRRGRIKANIEFDYEFIDDSRHEPMLVKTAKMGDGNHRVSLLTGSGTAILRR